MSFALLTLLCWGFVVLTTWLVRRLIPLPPEAPVESQSPSTEDSKARAEKHRLRSRRIGEELAENLRRQTKQHQAHVSVSPDRSKVEVLTADGFAASRVDGAWSRGLKFSADETMEDFVGVSNDEASALLAEAETAQQSPNPSSGVLLPQGWTPERAKRHQEHSDKMGDALVRSLNKAVLSEPPAPRALHIDLRDLERY